MPELLRGIVGGKSNRVKFHNTSFRDCWAWIWSTLERHHSRDRAFLDKIKTKFNKMTSQADTQPWRCKVCWRLVKAKQSFCPSCGGWWGEVNDSTYQKKQPRDQDWNWEAWEEQSPRRRMSSTSRKRNGSARAKGKGKGKDKDKGKDAAKEDATFPFCKDDDARKSRRSHPFPRPQHIRCCRKHHQEATSCCQLSGKPSPDSQTMPQEIKDAMERTESLVSKQLTQDLHRATTSMGKAQKTLKELMDSKERHRLQWLQHLAESLKGWQQQLGKLRYQTGGVCSMHPESQKRHGVCPCLDSKRSMPRLQGRQCQCPKIRFQWIRHRT